ncbi:MAG: reverse transcriptase family protein [Ferruginibacter sp.]
MIKNIEQLYHFLGGYRQVNYLMHQIEQCYYYQKKEKKKFGEFQRLKGEIQYRDLFIPEKILKIMQQKISEELSGIKLPDYMYGSIKGTNNIDHAYHHRNKKYYLKIDLKKFFPNIKHDQVFRTLVKIGYSWEVARIITRLTTCNGSLPQGAPSSPIISNLVFMETGNKLYDLAISHNIEFTTFLDDLVFSSNKDFRSLTTGFLDIIRSDYFAPSNKKITYRLNSCEITGVIVNGNTLDVIREMKEKAKNNKNLDAYVKHVFRYNK